MTVLVAAVIVVGALGAVNLLLALAIIRRLRGIESRRMPQPDSGPAAGSALPDFHAEALDGAPVSRETVGDGPSVFTFYSTTCSACPISIPYLADYISHQGLEPAQAVVVIGGNRDHADDFIAKLDGLATIVVEPALGPVARAFSANAYPTFVLSDGGGTVTRTQVGSRPLLEPATAA